MVCDTPQLKLQGILKRLPTPGELCKKTLLRCEVHARPTSFFYSGNLITFLFANKRRPFTRGGHNAACEQVRAASSSELWWCATRKLWNASGTHIPPFLSRCPGFHRVCVEGPFTTRA